MTLSQPMTMQEIFDKVVPATLEQGEKSINAYGSCRYRGENSLKCTIGHVIPDELYNLEMEFMTAQEVLKELGIIENETGFIVCLQAVHDQKNPKNWRKTFEDIANHFGLKWNYAA